MELKNEEKLKDEIIPAEDGSLTVLFPEDDKSEELSIVENKETEKKPSSKTAAATEGGEPEAIASLKRQLSEANKFASSIDAERIAAVRRAEESESKAFQFESVAQEQQYNSISTAINASKVELDSGKREYALAMENGDYLAAADAQEKISGAKSNINMLEAGKKQLETRLEARKAEAKALAERPKSSGDPVEDFVAGRSSKTAAWIRAHPEVVTNEKLQHRAYAAHSLAMAEGIAVDTEDYFKFVNQQLGFEKKEDVPGNETVAKDTPRKGSEKPVSAPVARAPAGGNPGSGAPKSVTLSKAEVEIAETMGITPQEYGRQKLIAIANGEISNA